MLMLFPFLIFCVASWVNPVAPAGDEALYMVGLEIHASKSITPAEAEKFHDICFTISRNGVLALQ
jgi:hypothetical protein